MKEMIAHAGIVLASLLGAVGCAETPAGPRIQFAVDGDSITPRVRATRVVASAVNLNEPIGVAVDGRNARVTFAQRGREGVDVALDAESLAPRGAAPRSYPMRPKGEPAPYLQTAPATVKLYDGRRLSVWNDESSGHVFARSESGALAVVWAGDAVGPPHAATSDGRNVVVAFVASTENGFELMALSIEAP